MVESITELLVGIFIAAVIGLIAVSQYQDGKYRNTLGVSLFAIGILLSAVDPIYISTNIVVICMLICAGILFEIDQKFQSILT